jgi:hypothetical protein
MWVGEGGRNQESMDGCSGRKGFDGLVTKVRSYGLPSAAVVAFHEGEEEL